MSPEYETPIARIIHDMEQLRRMLERFMSVRPLYVVLNEDTPAQITADMNNYAPGDFDVLRISTDASRNISGIDDGKKGRVLWIHNVGSQNIVLLHQSGLSSAENRIISASAANITLATNDSARLYYDSTDLRWRITVPNA